MYRIARWSSRLLILCFASNPLQASFFEDFNGFNLDPQWVLSMDGSLPPSNWTPDLDQSYLTLRDFNDQTRANAQWANGYLTRDVAPTSGDFKAAMKFNYNYGPSTTAIQNLWLDLINDEGEVAAYFQLHDQQFLHTPGYSFIAGEGGYGEGYDSLPNQSDGDIIVGLSRNDGQVSATWNGNAMSNFPVPLDDTISQVQLRFADYSYSVPASDFRPINIDSISWVGAPEPDILTAGTSLADLPTTTQGHDYVFTHVDQLFRQETNAIQNHNVNITNIPRFGSDWVVSSSTVSSDVNSFFGDLAFAEVKRETEEFGRLRIETSSESSVAEASAWTQSVTYWSDWFLTESVLGLGSLTVGGLGFNELSFDIHGELGGHEGSLLFEVFYNPHPDNENPADGHPAHQSQQLLSWSRSIATDGVGEFSIPITVLVPFAEGELYNLFVRLAVDTNAPANTQSFVDMANTIVLTSFESPEGMQTTSAAITQGIASPADFGLSSPSDDTANVPEPPVLIMLLSGLGLLGFARHKRESKGRRI